jgi:hypothetical protein
MTFTKQQIADACRRHCVDVRSDLIPDYDAARLLWAICGNESSFGADCKPRHEPAYDVGGRYAKDARQAALLEKYGTLGACSLGPMQVMLVNAPEGTAPKDFDDLDHAIAAGVYALNRILQHRRPGSLAEIGACYNGGHVPTGLWPDALRRYATRLLDHYAEPMPEPEEVPLKG